MEFSSDIALDGDLGALAQEIKNIFKDASGSKKINSEIYLMFVYIGMNLNYDELNEMENYKENRKVIVDESFNVPRTVLNPQHHDYKTALFCTYLKQRKQNLEISELQLLWNLEKYPTLNSKDQLAVMTLKALQKYVEDGAYYMGYLLFGHELSIDIINETILNIYKRNDMNDLVINSLNSTKINELDELLDV